MTCSPVVSGADSADSGASCVQVNGLGTVALRSSEVQWFTDWHDWDKYIVQRRQTLVVVLQDTRRQPQLSETQEDQLFQNICVGDDIIHRLLAEDQREPGMKCNSHAITPQSHHDHTITQSALPEISDGTCVIASRLGLSACSHTWQAARGQRRPNAIARRSTPLIRVQQKSQRGISERRCSSVSHVPECAREPRASAPHRHVPECQSATCHVPRCATWL